MQTLVEHVRDNIPQYRKIGFASWIDLAVWLCWVGQGAEEPLTLALAIVWTYSGSN
jgi:hypothetical protein